MKSKPNNYFLTEKIWSGLALGLVMTLAGNSPTSGEDAKPGPKIVVRRNLKNFVTYLSLSGSKVTDQDLATLSDYSDLNSVAICFGRSSTFTAEGLANSLADLSVTMIHFSVYHDDNFAWLVSLDKLRMVTRIELSVITLSKKLEGQLLLLNRTAKNLPSLYISVLDGESVTRDSIVKLDSLSEFANIQLSCRLNQAALAETCQKIVLSRIKVNP